jgi:peptide/nickel transport system permease protein
LEKADMASYLFRRTAQAVIICLAVSFVTFLLTLVLPGDPAVAVAGPKAPPEVLHQIRRELGLDRPLLVQYAKYVGRIVRGDFGRSYVTGEPVAYAVIERLPATAFLGATAWVLAVLFGLLFGCLGALRPRVTPWILGTTVFAFAVPPFWLGMLCLYLFAYRWPLFPLGGFSVPGVVLPACALAVGLAASYARVVSSQLSEVLSQDFIRTARAKGLSEERVVFVHGLRNALLTVMTMAGLDLAGLLGGVTLTETVFNWPGMGRLAVEAVFNQDLPMLMGTVLFATVLVVGANVLVDACYAFVDPRIRKEV